MVSTNQTYLFNRFFAISPNFFTKIQKTYAKLMHRFKKNRRRWKLSWEPDACLAEKWCIYDTWRNIFRTFATAKFQIAKAIIYRIVRDAYQVAPVLWHRQSHQSISARNHLQHDTLSEHSYFSSFLVSSFLNSHCKDKHFCSFSTKFIKKVVYLHPN